MSEDLLRKLQLLEEDYPAQPPSVRQADLQEINQIRSHLGMPLVDARLNEVGVAAVEEDVEETPPAPEEVQDHTEAREIYRAYLEKVKELEVHRAYAEQVVRATSGHGQTPVRPLATMGTDGPLLCDHCGKPIVLEGGRFHGVTADVAWRRNPRDGWTSYILGGMVVEIQTNGTLRIYHGYPDRNPGHCCNVASRKRKEAREAFESDARREKAGIIRAFIEQGLTGMTSAERQDLLNKILDTMYGYDPGLGINRPGRAG